MIDHFELESKVVDVNSKEGREQIQKFGIPEPWSGIRNLELYAHNVNKI